MRVFLRSLIKKMAYVLAACIILAAIVVIIVRLFTPVLDRHRTDFEKLASHYLQMPVSINKVRVSWYQYHPVIRLSGVDLLDKTSGRPLLQIKTVNLLFSVPQSLWRHQVVTSGIVLSGAELTLQKTAQGEYHLANFPAWNVNTKAQGAQDQAKAALAWILLQPKLALNNINIIYQGPSGVSQFFTLYQLTVENSRKHHILHGRAIQHQALPTETTFTVKWSGDVLDPAHIKAQAYVYISGLSAAQWLQGLSIKGWQANEGLLSAKIWARWGAGTLQAIQGQFQAYELALYSTMDRITHKVHRFSGNLGWKREGDSVTIAGDDLLLDLPNHLWPATHFHASLTQKADGQLSLQSINVGYVDFHDVQSFLLSSPGVLPSTIQNTLTALQLSGELQDFSLNTSNANALTDWDHLSMYADFNNVAFNAYDRWPGMSGLSGNLKWNGTDGEASLKGVNSAFEDKHLFSDKIELAKWSSSLQFKRGQKNSWLLVIPSAQAENTDLDAKANGTVLFFPGSLPTTDLRADFTLHQAAHITRYLPMQIFKPDLVKWLRSAFIAGHVESGHAILQGKLNDFPFDQSKGLFEITGKAKQVELKFAPDWPLVQQADGTLSFRGRQMILDMDHAETLGAVATQIHGNISNLGNPSQVLTISTGNIQADFVKGLHYIHTSPLEKTIGKLFSNVEMEGPIDLKLDLTVPLKYPGKTQVSGTLNIKDGQMDLVPWSLNLKQVNGQAHFTEKSLDATNISALLFDKPLQLDLLTKQRPQQQSVVQARFTSNIEIKDLENWLKLPFSSFAQGSANAIGSIDFPFNGPIAIHLRSDLVGTSVNLPNPYSKTSQEARPFLADMVVQAGHPLQMKLSYGDLLRLAIIPTQNEYDIEIQSPEIMGRIHLPAHLNRQSFITAQLQKLYLKPLKGVAPNQLDLNAKNMPSLSIVANDVRYDDKPLGEVQFKAVPSEQGMSIQNLRMISPRLSLNATGTWTQQGKTPKTHLHGKATSSEITTLLNSLGLNASNFLTENGSLVFDLIWDGVPFMPSLANIDGRLSLSIGEGRIVNIGSSNNAKMDIGRMLNIFSLQTIPRRLTLDFSDVFEKGYSFDSAKGDFTMQQGDLYTKDFHFDGPVAKVSINGRIGLTKKDYDLILGVTAHVTSSLPVAATLLWNPYVGLGALAVNTLLGSKLSNVTTSYYAVTGTWNNPAWKHLK